MTRHPHRSGWLAICLSAAFLTSCANKLANTPFRTPPPPTEEVRARLGTVRVESAGTGTEAEFAKPLTRGEAAAKGAFESSMGVAQGMSGSGGLGGVVAVAIMPFAAAIGGAASASKGTPEEEIKATESALLGAFSQMDYQRAVRDKVVQFGRKYTRHPFVTGAGNGDSVLQLNVVGAGLTGSTNKGAPLAMFLRIHVRLLDSKNGALLYERTFVQSSGAYSFNVWGANGGRLLRNHLPVISGIIAQNIIAEVFLSHRPSKRR